MMIDRVRWWAAGADGWLWARLGAHSHRPMLDLILFLFYSYCVKQNKLLNIFIWVPHTSISEWESEGSEWSVIGLTPRAAYCPAPGPFFRRAPGSWNSVANQLHLYTIREGTVRYSPFSKELSNYKINIFSLSLCAHSRKKTVSPRGGSGGYFFCEAISICEWKTSAGSADGSGVWSSVTSLSGLRSGGGCDCLIHAFVATPTQRFFSEPLYRSMLALVPSAWMDRSSLYDLHDV